MNQWYGKALQLAAGAGLNFTGANIKALLVSASYTPNLSTDNFVAVIPGAAILSRSGNFSGKTNTLGVLDCAVFTFPLVASGVVGKYVIPYIDTGADATSTLLICDDTAQGLPVTGDGGNIVVQTDAGPNKLAQV